MLQANEKNAANSVLYQHKSDAFDFLDLGSFALALAQIVQLRAADFTAADHIHVIHTG